MSTHAPTAPAEKPSATTVPTSTQGVTLNAAFAGVRRVPAAGQRAEQQYAPGSPQRGDAEGPAEVDGGRKDRNPADHRRTRDPHRQDEQLGDAARSRARAGRVPSRAVPNTFSRRLPPRAAARREWCGLAVGRPRRGAPARRRAARHHLAPHDQRRDDARAVEDGVPVRDRCRLAR